MISSTSSSLSHEQYLRKKRNRKLFRYWLAFFIFVGLLALVSYIAHRPQIRISKIELSGGVLVTQADIESKSFEYLKGSYFLLFPRNNIFLYSKDGLENYLREIFKRIDIIGIHQKGLKTLAVDIKERKPVAMWCGDLPSDSEECYFLDQNSTIFSKAPHFSGDAYFKYYGLISGNDPMAKKYIASSTKFAEVSDFISKTKGLSLQPQYLIAKDDGQFSLFIAGGGEIIFDTKQSLSIVAQNLEALLRTPVLSTTTDIDYIDLRYGNKLFYKLK